VSSDQLQYEYARNERSVGLQPTGQAFMLEFYFLLTAIRSVRGFWLRE
jgi:hypothetical protein